MFPASVDDTLQGVALLQSSCQASTGMSPFFQKQTGSSLTKQREALGRRRTFDRFICKFCLGIDDLQQEQGLEKNFPRATSSNILQHSAFISISLFPLKKDYIVLAFQCILSSSERPRDPQREHGPFPKKRLGRAAIWTASPPF